MKNIEVEVRSFISRNEYKKLEKILKKEAKLIGLINEETVYLGGTKNDLRIRRNKKEASLILKVGKIHDDFREEIEIKLKKDDFKKTEELFERLGHKEKIRWFRKRLLFKWGEIKVFLDDTKDYGLIVELERIGFSRNKKEIHRELENKLKHLGIKATPKKVFEEKFKYYKNNWKKF
jgi:predicted adenylyl cyclase CyaB